MQKQEIALSMDVVLKQANGLECPRHRELLEREFEKPAEPTK